MNEQELRDKIIGIVLDIPITGIKIRGILGGEATANAIADALIAANIGDVTEWKEQVACAKRILQIPTLPNGTTDFSYFEYKGERIQDIARQRDEYKHRAEVAEKEREEYRNSNQIVLRGIEIIKRNILRYCATDFPTILQQAEKELQEEGKNE